MELLKYNPCITWKKLREVTRVLHGDGQRGFWQQAIADAAKALGRSTRTIQPQVTFVV